MKAMLAAALLIGLAAAAQAYDGQTKCYETEDWQQMMEYVAKYILAKDAASTGWKYDLRSNQDHFLKEFLPSVEAACRKHPMMTLQWVTEERYQWGIGKSQNDGGRLR